MENVKNLIEQVLVAEVLILGQMLKAEKKSRGVTSTSDFTQEAASLIRQKRQHILEILR